jgi:hypothetical protein
LLCIARCLSFGLLVGAYIHVMNFNALSVALMPSFEQSRYGVSGAKSSLECNVKMLRDPREDLERDTASTRL